MIKTRDFLIYVIIFTAVITGIVLTIYFQTDTKTPAVPATLLTAKKIDLKIDTSTTDVDRVSNLSDVRKKIIAGEGLIKQGPPVLTYVSSTPTTSNQAKSTSPGSTLAKKERAPQYCKPLSSNQITTVWPVKVTLSQVEGARLVRTINTTNSSATVGSSTPLTTSYTLLIQLPISQTKLPKPTCLRSDIIGVALDGTLILNDQPWRFRNMSSKSIIGYALDGYPIYGQGVSNGKLDECGGYSTANGYEYHIRAEDKFILGCYTATPAIFQI